MKPFINHSHIPRTALLLPIFFLFGCPSANEGHEGHDHGPIEGQDHHEDESSDEHAGHDHAEEGSK